MPAQHRGCPARPSGVSRRGNFPPLPPASWVSPPPSCRIRDGTLLPAPARATPATGSRRAPSRPPPPSRVLSGSPRGREFPSTSKSRSEPVVVAVQQLVEDPTDVFRVEVRPVTLAPQRLLHAARRGESRRQPPRLSPSAGLAPSSPRLSPPAKLAPVEEPAPRGEQRREEGPAPPRLLLRAAAGFEGAFRGVGGELTHLTATQTQAMSRAMPQVCAKTLRCPQTRQLEQASVLILPSPLGQGLRRVRISESPAGSPPSPSSSAVLCPGWGGGGVGVCRRVCPLDSPPPFSLI